MMQNLVGLNVSARADYVNVAHAWYVTYYLLFLLICPLIVSNRIPNSILLDIFLLILVAALIQVLPECVQKNAWPLPASITGYMVSKYKMFTVLGVIRRGRYTSLISVLILLVMVAVRHESSLINKWGAFDGIFAFGTILSLKTSLSSIPEQIKRGVIWIGTYGMFYWFLHSAFVIWRNPLLEILYMPYYPIAITLWGIVLTTPFVFVCNWIATKIKTLLLKK